jgi:hypothetical protein
MKNTAFYLSRGVDSFSFKIHHFIYQVDSRDLMQILLCTPDFDQNPGVVALSFQCINLSVAEIMH